MGDLGGVCHQPEAAHRADEHEQRHGEQHVSWNRNQAVKMKTRRVV